MQFGERVLTVTYSLASAERWSQGEADASVALFMSAVSRKSNNSKVLQNAGDLFRRVVVL